MTTLSQPWVLQNIFLGISFPVNNEHGKKRINSNSVRSTLFPPASATVLGTLPGQPAPLSTQDGNLEGSPFIPSPQHFTARHGLSTLPANNLPLIPQLTFCHGLKCVPRKSHLLWS